MAQKYLDMNGLTRYHEGLIDYMSEAVGTQGDMSVTDPTNMAYIKNVPDWVRSETKPEYDATEVGADATGTAHTEMSNHDVSETAHEDIRNLIQGINTQIEESTWDDKYTKEEVDNKDAATLASAKEYNDSAYANANAYTDQKIADLINGAPTTLDTLGEIATAMADNKDVVDALDEAIGTKANQSELDTHTGNDVIHVTADNKTEWNKNTTDIANILNGTTPVGNALKLNGLTAEEFAKYNPTLIKTADGLISLFEASENGIFFGEAGEVTIESLDVVYARGIYIIQKDNQYGNITFIGNGKIAIRNLIAGNWQNWTSSADGGNADTVDGFHAYEVQAMSDDSGTPFPDITGKLEWQSSGAYSGHMKWRADNDNGTSYPVMVDNADTVDGYHASELMKTASPGRMYQMGFDSEKELYANIDGTKYSIPFGMGRADVAKKAEVLPLDGSVPMSGDLHIDSSDSSVRVINYQKNARLRNQLSENNYFDMKIDDGGELYHEGCKNGNYYSNRILHTGNAHDYTVELIAGTQTAATGSWTGVSKSTSLYHGKQILYQLPYAGSGNATLNLTLANGTTTGAKECYYSGATRLTTHYAAGSTIRLVYLVDNNVNGTKYTGWWADANYDSNNKVQITANAPTSSTTYYPLMHTSTSGTTAVTANSIVRYSLLTGTTSAVGVSQLTLGNNTASGTANNSSGKIALYGTGAYYTMINAGAPTANRTITLPDASGTVALTGHTHSYLPLTGGTLTNNLAINPSSGGEGGQIDLGAGTANKTSAGIVLDTVSSTFRIFGIASADGSTKTGVGTPLVIDPYGKKITGGYTMTGYTVSPAATDYTTNRNRNTVFTTTDPGAGVSTSHANGSIICVYE